MELPPEIWCKILRYLDIEGLERLVYADSVENEMKQEHLDKLTETLHYTVWCLRCVMERISSSQYQLESSLACLHRGEALLQPTLRPYHFDTALEQIQSSIKMLGETEAMYAKSVRAMGEAIDMIRREADRDAGVSADNLPDGYVNL